MAVPQLRAASPCESGGQPTASCLRLATLHSAFSFCHCHLSAWPGHGPLHAGVFRAPWLRLPGTRVSPSCGGAGVSCAARCQGFPGRTAPGQGRVCGGRAGRWAGGSCRPARRVGGAFAPRSMSAWVW